MFPQVNLETDALLRSVEGSPKSEEEGDYWQFQKANRYQLPRGAADKVAIKLLESLLLPRAFLQFACCHSGAELCRSAAMLLLMSLVFVILDCLLGAPTGREVYRMPQSALKGIFKHFSFQVGLFSHLSIVVTRVLSSNYSLGNVFLQL